MNCRKKKSCQGVKKIKLSVNEILRLETCENSNSKGWINPDIFNEFIDNDLYQAPNEKLRERLLIVDKIHGVVDDYRQRSLEIVSYNSTPFLIFQDNGEGGSYSNILIINRVAFNDAMSWVCMLCLEYELKNLDSHFNVCEDIEDALDITAYNAYLKIKGNKLEVY